MWHRTTETIIDSEKHKKTKTRFILEKEAKQTDRQFIRSVTELLVCVCDTCAAKRAFCVWPYASNVQEQYQWMCVCVCVRMTQDELHPKNSVARETEWEGGSSGCCQKQCRDDEVMHWEQQKQYGGREREGGWEAPSVEEGTRSGRGKWEDENKLNGNVLSLSSRKLLHRVL